MLQKYKPSLAFYMGYSEAFNGKNYNSKNVFGSEINTIKLAESLTHLYNITIFVNIEETDEIIFHSKAQFLVGELYQRLRTRVKEFDFPDYHLLNAQTTPYMINELLDLEIIYLQKYQDDEELDEEIDALSLSDSSKSKEEEDKKIDEEKIKEYEYALRAAAMCVCHEMYEYSKTHHIDHVLMSPLDISIYLEILQKEKMKKSTRQKDDTTTITVDEVDKNKYSIHYHPRSTLMNTYF